MDILPLELIQEIAEYDPDVYWILIFVIKAFGYYTCNPNIRKQFQTRFGMSHVKWSFNLEEYKMFGKLHRTSGPAYIAPDICRYYQHGKPTRLDGPAVICSNGTQIYYLDGKIHRVDGPAYISQSKIEYKQFDQFHRVDGPAIINTNCIEYFIDGKRPIINDVGTIQFNHSSVSKDMKSKDVESNEHKFIEFMSQFIDINEQILKIILPYYKQEKIPYITTIKKIYYIDNIKVKEIDVDF